MGRTSATRWLLFAIHLGSLQLNSSDGAYPTSAGSRPRCQWPPKVAPSALAAGPPIVVSVFHRAVFGASTAQQGKLDHFVFEVLASACVSAALASERQMPTQVNYVGDNPSAKQPALFRHSHGSGELGTW